MWFNTYLGVEKILEKVVILVNLVILMNLVTLVNKVNLVNLADLVNFIRHASEKTGLSGKNSQKIPFLAALAALYLPLIVSD